MKFLIAALIFVMSSNSAIAADENLEICNAGGYYAGAQNRFMMGLAMHILAKQGLLGTVTCNELWKSAYDVGVSFSKTGKVVNNKEEEIIKQASNFNEKVYSSIAKSIGY